MGRPVNYWLVSTGPQDQPGMDGGIVNRADRRDREYLSLPR